MSKEGGLRGSGTARRNGRRRDKGALSRAISTAHCPMLVAHNSDPVQLGPFPRVQKTILYTSGVILAGPVDARLQSPFLRL